MSGSYSSLPQRTQTSDTVNSHCIVCSCIQADPRSHTVPFTPVYQHLNQLTPYSLSLVFLRNNNPQFSFMPEFDLMTGTNRCNPHDLLTVKSQKHRIVDITLKLIDLSFLRLHIKRILILLEAQEARLSPYIIIKIYNILCVFRCRVTVCNLTQRNLLSLSSLSSNTSSRSLFFSLYTVSIKSIRYAPMITLPKIFPARAGTQSTILTIILCKNRNNATV